MKKSHLITYWIATALLAFGMLQSGLAQLFHMKAMIDLVVPLGYPTYFPYIIGTWKILGVIAILIPRAKLLKEWAYAGFAITMISGFIAHLSSGDPIWSASSALVALNLLLASYFTYHRLQTV